MDIRAALALRWMQRGAGCVLLILAAVLAVDALAQIPIEANRWKRDLVRNARVEWGLDAPTSTFAAQVHQESTWRADVTSHAGAQGMAQFMPATGEWIAGLYSQLGPADPLNPAWALRAMVAYDRHLYRAFEGATHCERMAKALSGYNGGAGWVRRDETLAASRGLDASRWFDNVETVNAGRSVANWNENRGYPRRILHVLEKRYRAAGWGMGSC